jgi:hypothetical protein
VCVCVFMNAFKSGEVQCEFVLHLNVSTLIIEDVMVCIL